MSKSTTQVTNLIIPEWSINIVDFLIATRTEVLLDWDGQEEITNLEEDESGEIIESKTTCINLNQGIKILMSDSDGDYMEIGKIQIGRYDLAKMKDELESIQLNKD